MKRGHRKPYFNNGMNYKQVASAVGVPHQTVSGWVRNIGIPKTTANPVFVVSQIKEYSKSCKFAHKRMRYSDPYLKSIVKDLLSKVERKPFASFDQGSKDTIGSLILAYKDLENIIGNKTLKGIISEEALLDLKDARDFLQGEIFNVALERMK